MIRLLREAKAGLMMKGKCFVSQTRTISNSSSRFIGSSSFPLMGKFIRNSNKENAHSHDTSSFSLLGFVLSAPAILVGINLNPVFANDQLQKVEDGSVVSNIHTSKWRVFTDQGRDLSRQGKLHEAEHFFILALQEAKLGFGETDPHVASSCNNLAELYRVRKAFDKAEPLYLKAISILEDSFGPQDIRVGVACHNLAQFYLVQKNLEQARLYYERALKIKGRVLGYAHTDYADTMYHLGTVLHLQGKEKDSESLIQDSIRILEEDGQGESVLYIRRLRYLAQLYQKSNRLLEAESLHRKILHILELSKGWNSLDTVVAAEGLALALQSAENLREAQELLERCLVARKALLPEDHIQIGANMLHMARVLMLSSNHSAKMDISKAIGELHKAKELLKNSTGVAQKIVFRCANKETFQNNREFGQNQRDERAALIILLQSLDALGILEINRQELQGSIQKHLPVLEAENALLKCINSYKEFGEGKHIAESPEVKTEYLSCLKRFSNLVSDGSVTGKQEYQRSNLQELDDKIRHVEEEIARLRKQRSQTGI